MGGAAFPIDWMPVTAPHLIYIAWGFPPARGSGVHRAVGTPNAFVKAGWRVTVITADRESFLKYTGADTSMERLVDPRIRVVRVPYLRRYLEDDVSTWSRRRVIAPYVWLTAEMVRERIAFPEDRYGFWYPALRRAVRRVHASEPADLVIGTANPNVDLAGAAALPDVPYVMDYRDAWQLNTFTGERATARGGREDRWETRLMAGAAEIWFVNEPILRWHADLHPAHAHKMFEVPNGADTGITLSQRPAGDGIRFTYVGTITSVVPVRELADGWALASERGRLDGAEGTLYGHVGFFNRQDSPEQANLDYLLKTTSLTYGGPLPKDHLGDTYRASDVLILAMGGGEYITSGKTYEYMTTGLPIVSVHRPESAASAILRDYPLWFPAASLAPDDVAAALAAAAEAVRTRDEETFARAAAYGTGFHREEILRPHIERLTRMVRP